MTPDKSTSPLSVVRPACTTSEQASRNLADFCFPSAMTLDARAELERIVTKVLASRCLVSSLSSSLRWERFGKVMLQWEGVGHLAILQPKRLSALRASRI